MIRQFLNVIFNTLIVLMGYVLYSDYQSEIR